MCVPWFGLPFLQGGYTRGLNTASTPLRLGFVRVPEVHPPGVRYSSRVDWRPRQGARDPGVCGTTGAKPGLDGLHGSGTPHSSKLLTSVDANEALETSPVMSATVAYLVT